MANIKEENDFPKHSPLDANIAPELRIVEWQNEWIVRSPFEFSYPEPNELLVELRGRYKLDDVISSGRTEWEQILLVREWVRNKWDHGWSQALPEKTTNALAILREVERGNDFHCVYYAITPVSYTHLTLPTSDLV